jgi:hypothetical protein
MCSSSLCHRTANCAHDDKVNPFMTTRKAWDDQKSVGYANQSTMGYYVRLMISKEILSLPFHLSLL